MYLVDTKVISEAHKGERANAGVRAFFAKASEQDWPLFFASIAIINRESSQGLAIPLGEWHFKPSSGLLQPDLLQQHRQGFTQLEPVAGGVCVDKSALSNKESSLDSSAARRLFSISSCFVRCSMS
jgi:hypothetical protein